MDKKEEREFYSVVSNVFIAITQFTAVGLLLFYYLSDPRFNISLYILIIVEILYILILGFIYWNLRRRLR